MSKVRTHQSPDGLLMNVGDFITRLGEDKDLAIELQQVIQKGLRKGADPIWVIALTVISAVVKVCEIDDDQVAALIQQNKAHRMRGH